MNMIIQRLKADLNLDRLHNSYLIKTNSYETVFKDLKTFVQIELLNIKNGDELHPDFMLIEKEKGNVKGISVDQIRLLQKFLYKTSVISGRKIAVILGAEQMNLNASNSCLKILEDTPANSYLFLLTKNLANILPTIRSRCAKIYDKVSNMELVINEKYLFPLLKSAPLNEKLQFIKQFSSKDRNLWTDFSATVEVLLCRLIKKVVGCNLQLTAHEEKILSQFTSHTPNYLLEKFEKVRTLIDDTINFDLDLQASCILMMDNFRR